MTKRGDVESTCRVSVVMPAHNAAETIGEQLDALARQTFAEPFEVVVVANRCTDHTVEIARAFADRLPDLTVIVANAKASPAYARNCGARSSSGTLLLFCDADDIVDARWVEEMVSAMQSADVVGGKLIPLAPYDYWSYRRHAISKSPGLATLDGTLAYAISASLGCHRFVLEAIGGWDERFGADSDDVAFCLAAQRAGFRMGFAGAALCQYRLRQSTREVLQQHRRYSTGRADLVRYYQPYAYPAIASAVLGTAAFIMRKSVKIRTRSAARDLFAEVTDRISYNSALWSWRRTLPQSVRKVEQRQRNIDFLVTLVGRRVRALQHSERFRNASQRIKWGQPIVDMTFDVDLPLLGGLGAVAPKNIAHLYTSRGDLTEPVSLTVVGRLVKPGDSFLDVGANIGLYSMAAAVCVGTTGTISAVEPNPVAADALAANIQRHAHCATRIIRSACGAHSGALEMKLDVLSLLGGVADSPYSGNSPQAAQVEMLSIDNYNSGHSTFSRSTSKASNRRCSTVQLTRSGEARMRSY